MEKTHRNEDEKRRSGRLASTVCGGSQLLRLMAIIIVGEIKARKEKEPKCQSTSRPSKKKPVSFCC